ncbi:MAG: hypothetical protein WB611_20630 [Stellaceae bacterium]
MVEIPKRLDTKASVRYLRDKHGIPITEKTLRNRRADGKKRGPACRYFGNKPLYDVPELDRWAEEDALQAENPVRRNVRLREEARAKPISISSSPAAEGPLGHPFADGKHRAEPRE